MRSALTLAGFLLLAACADASPDRAVEAQQSVPDSMVVTDDPDLRTLAMELLPSLVGQSGLELRRPVRLARRSREELEAYLLAKMDQDLPPDRARNLVAAYAALGLMDPDTDLRALLLSVYQEQVAGFYDPDSTALFVLEDQGGAALAPLLTHELVHALQDQAVDLESLTDPSVGNDRATAAQAAVEGHATLVMFEVTAAAAQGQPVDLTTVPGFAEQLRSLMGSAGASYPELAAAPRIIRESVLLPYVEGTGFVLAAWADGVRGDFADLLPESTEQVIRPERFLSDPPDAPTSLELDVAGGTVRYSDVLGAAETRILLEERAGLSAEEAAVGWDGDRYAVVDGPDGETFLWLSVWDDEGSRDRFLSALSEAQLAPGREKVLESLELDGRPGVLLRVGPEVGGVRTGIQAP